MPPTRLSHLALLLSFVLVAAQARAETFVLQVPISGDVVAVTLEIVDAPGGGGVDFDVSVPPGEGDLLGLFGNVVDESLVDQLTVDNPTGILTQWQFKKDKVWKVGGGNVMAPVKKWDWGLRIGQNGSAGGAVEQANFGLRAPGLDVAQVLNAVNQGWMFGVRVQGTSGSEGSSKMGLPDGQPPVGSAPTVTIDQPPDGTITNQTPATIVGTVSGSPEPTVDVNGQAATVTGGSFTIDLALAEGSNTVTATATNSQGTANDAITVVLDTVAPVVTISVPADGATLTQTDVLVEGTVADMSPIASFQIEGVDVPLTADATRTAGNAVLVTGTVSGSGDPAVDVNGTPVTVGGGSFSLNLPLALGANAIVATATSAFGTASDAIAVFRGELPAVAISVPADGLLTATPTVTVSGTVSGLPEPTVDVGGTPAPLTSGAFSVEVSLLEGGNALTANASNEFGSDADTVAVTLDTTPPVVVIASPQDGATTDEAQATVTGTVVDASPIASLTVNGALVSLVGSGFTTTVDLLPGQPTLIEAVATDAVGNVGSDAVTVVFEPPAQLTITIDSPPDGSLVSKRRIDVAGRVTSPGTARVEVNGVLATVVGGSYLAPQVELVEGANELVATATEGTGSASASTTVTFNAPPIGTITSPRNGAFLQDPSVDVVGVVDDPAAFVDVQGVLARVDSSGRFVASGVSVSLGTSSLTARAVDALGATGTDVVEVTREASAVGQLRVVLVIPERFGFGFDVEDEGPPPMTVVVEDAAEFREALKSLGLPASGFTPEVDDVYLGFSTSNLHIYVFAEAGTVGATVQIPAIFEDFFNFQDSAPLEDIDALPASVSSAGFDASILAELLPDDFDPNGFAHFDVFIAVGN